MNVSGLFLDVIKAFDTVDHGKLIEWFRYNRLSLNIEKTVLLQYGKMKNGKNQILWFNNSKVRLTDVIKYLGFDKDSQLNFKSHISRICKKNWRNCVDF